MNGLYSDWSNVLLMDSITKQPRRQSHRLLSNLRKSPPTYKSTPFKRIFRRPKVERKIGSQATKVNKSRKTTERNKEHDTWNVLTETLNQQLIATHQIHRSNNDIGILTNQSDNIQLIHDRDEFNKLTLVGSDGSTISAKRLIDPIDSDSSISFKLKFRMVPVIEGISVTNHYSKNSYIFNSGNSNNETDVNAEEAMETKSSSDADSTSSTLMYDTESSVARLDFTDMYEKINNTVNISAAPNEYSEFLKQMQSNDDGNAPMFSTPKK